MATTELGACEWFVWDLRRSNLIDRGRLDALIGEFLSMHPGAEPPALAEYLVAQKILTQFQADRLLQGKTQGFVLGPYTLMDALGSGSMGTVYKAVSKTDSRWYAVKVLPRRSMWNVRIARRKVRAFEGCKHPAVVPFVDVGTSGGMHYLTWPLVEGEPLDQVVQRQGKLAPATAAHYVLQAARGLEVCHTQGLFHGLLKPSNLMLGSDGQIRILDLGIGSLLAETEGESLVDTMSSANSMASGLDCASPESIMDPNNLTPTGDQYSLGCVLYYCLAGRYPFPEGTAVEKMMAHQTKEPEAITDVVAGLPAELAAVVEKLMQKKPEARFASTREVIAALEPLAADAPLPPPRAARRSTVTQRRPAAPAPLHDTPRPERRSAPAAPAAEKVRSPERPKPERPKGAPPARPVPAPAPHPGRVPTPEFAGAVDPPVRRSLEERIGPIGIAAIAIVACAIAWLVTWKLF
jgi:serine/threonine-protein kinase